MKQAKSEESKQTISDLLDSILPKEKIETLFNEHRYCLLFHDIISYSIIGQHIDFLLWIVFFVMMDFLIFMQALPITLFTNLNYHILTFEYDSTKFIDIRVTLQQISIFLNVIIFFFIFYQWYIFFTYSPKKHLTKKTASFFQFTIFHFPTIVTPFLGIFYGINVICNSDSRFSAREGILLTLFILIGVIFLLINHTIYTYFITYSLTLKKGQFAYWSPPYRAQDIFYFFLTGFFCTFRSGPYDKYVTISCVVGIIYGIFTSIKYRGCNFIFLVGKLFYLKIALDSIVCNVIAIISIWAKLSFVNTIIALFVCFVGTSLIAFFMLGPENPIAPANLSVNGARGFSQSKIRNPEQALFVLRNGISFSISGVSDREFLQYILQNHFSPSVLTDVLRMCIFSRIKIDTVYLPKVILSPLDVIALKYTTFQYQIYENMVKDEEDPVVKKVYKLLEHHYARAEELLDTFWTENDVKQLNIYQLGSSILDISNDFAKYGSIYTKCPSIQKIWKSYTTDVLAMPSAKKYQLNAVDDFVYANRGIFSFLFNNNNNSRPNKEEPKSELEKYFRSFQNYNIRPILGLFIATTISIIIASIYFGINSNLQTRISAGNFINVSNIMKYSITTAGALISSLDSITVYPLTETISELLGISMDDARLFRSQKITPVDYGIDRAEMLHRIPELKSIKFTTTDCPAISYSLLTNYPMPDDTSFSKRICYFYSILFFCDQLSQICNDKVHSYHNSFQWRSKHFSNEAIMYCCILVVIIIFVIFFFIFDRRMHNLFLKAVAYISCSGSNKNFTERIDFAFTFTAQLFNYIGLLCCLLILFYGHFLPVNSFKSKIDVITNVTYSICLAVVKVEELMSAVLLEMMQDQSNAFPSELIYDNCYQLTQIVNNITHSDIPDEFLSVYPFSDWIMETGTPFNMLFHDWTHFVNITSGTASKETFRFLYIRYIYLMNFTQMIDDAIPEVINNLYKEMQRGSFLDLYLYHLGILLSLLCLSIYLWMYRRKKTWYYGASLLLRRRIAKDQRFIIITRQILEGKVPEYLDLLPFASVVKDEKGRIIDSNWLVQSFTPFTSQQLIGQPSDEIFAPENLVDVEIAEYKSNHGHKLMILKDLSGIASLNTAKQTLIERYDPKIKLPFENNAFYIEIRFMAGSFEPPKIFELVESVEKKYESVFKRVAIGVSFYAALANKDSNKKQIYEFITEFYEAAQHKVIIAATYGFLVCFSLLEDTDVNMVASGEPVKRAHEILVYGLPEKIYIDYKIIKSTKGELPDHILAISPLVM
ncbi:hypothetical protein TRFO_00952 [Tritrichomonas foetus]|uniref:PAS domain-containing protein n=1 Tax=Tritrichomonas foetus TaxID=1144522 RepID=A0A1J4L6T6_9EUKA|nr:hypothetical protein TRFO_00952 [Tritrichomonas foetus]|eukprot:OHT17661.1 hypothetical protein TRFO_00952 [Tritrichomonas foetus]